MTEALPAPLLDEGDRVVKGRKTWTAPLVIVASGPSGAAKTSLSATEHHKLTSTNYSS